MPISVGMFFAHNYYDNLFYEKKAMTKVETPYILAREPWGI